MLYSNQAVKANQVPGVITVEQKASMKGFNFGLGGSFSRDSLWGKDYRLALERCMRLNQILMQSVTTLFYRLNTNGDTLETAHLNTKYGSVKIPSTLTVGFALSKGSRWTIGTDFMYQNWSNFTNINEDRQNLGKAWEAIIGGEFTPDPYALSSFLKRITYRAGASVEQYPWLANKSVKDVGINLGLSLPAGRSSVDLAARFGKRGDKQSNGIEESYFKLYFGITFNDQWFIKRKFD